MKTSNHWVIETLKKFLFKQSENIITLNHWVIETLKKFLFKQSENIIT